MISSYANYAKAREIEPANQRKGFYYESLVAKYYREQGYMTFNHAYTAGKNDKGIDVICFKE